MNQKSHVKKMLTVAFVTVAVIGLATSTMVFSIHRAEAAKSDSNKPVDGYDNPQGYFTVIKHVYNDPNLRVSVFCKPGDKVVYTCQVYDSGLRNARLIGIEYVITPKEYNSLPAEEKPNWFIINNLLSTTVQGHFPELNAQQINATLHNHLLGNYDKIILTCSL